MNTILPDRITAEAEAMVADSLRTRHPQSSLNEHYRRLLADPAWEPSIAAEVYQAATRMLKARLPARTR